MSDKQTFRLYLLLLCCFLSWAPSWDAQAGIEVPPEYQQRYSAPGIQIYHNGLHYVQVVNLNQGGVLRSFRGKIVDAAEGQGNYGANNPSFRRSTVRRLWENLKPEIPGLIGLVNGQFFDTNSSPATRLAFPLKAAGIIVSGGYGVLEYQDQKLMLQLWSDHAEIVKFSPEAFLASEAPDVIVGLTEDANKSASRRAGRTFIGVASRDNNNRNEVVLIFTSTKASQKEAAHELRRFGASTVMMLDGGGSTQFHGNDGWYVKSSRPVPHAIGALSKISGNWLSIYELQVDRFGPAKVGMSPDEASRSLGISLSFDPDYPYDPGCDYVYPNGKNEGIGFMVLGGTIYRIDVYSNAVAAAGGIRVGSRESVVKNTFPGIVIEEPHPYEDQGKYLIVDVKPEFSFVFETRKGRVTSFRAGDSDAVRWIEGCD